MKNKTETKKQDKQYILSIWKQTQFNFFFILGLITTLLLIVRYTNIGFLGILTILITAQLAKLLLFKQFTPRNTLNVIIMSTLLLSAIWYLPGLLGWWVLIVIILGFAAYRVYKGRKVYMSSMRFIEGKLFGRPLDRREWVRGQRPSFYFYELNDVGGERAKDQGKARVKK